MSGWDPHRDLARLLEALGREIVCSGEGEVRAACLGDGDSVMTAAQEVRELIGALTAEPDAPAADMRPFELVEGAAHRGRQH